MFFVSEMLYLNLHLKVGILTSASEFASKFGPDFDASKVVHLNCGICTCASEMLHLSLHLQLILHHLHLNLPLCEAAFAI